MASVPDSKQPWDSWDVELPLSDESKEAKEYALLHDEKFHRDLTLEVRKRAISKMMTALQPTKNAAVVLKGGTEQDFALYDSDTDKCPFRQEAFFHYLFWINEPDCYGVIDLERQESLLFVPEIPDSAERWNGTRLPLSYYTERYGVDATYLTKDLASELARRNLSHLFVLYGVNSDSGSATTTTADFDGIDRFTVDKAALHPLLCELRVHKTPKEIELLRVGSLISSQAHIYVMRHIKPRTTELQCEALFKSWTAYYGGARHMAYTCICGAGNNGSILHYGHAGRPNDKLLRDGDMIVLDMGAEYFGYATDITRSYPVNGRFTDDQRAIFNAVAAAQKAVMEAMRPGVRWADMHKLAERVILQHLLALGLLHNGTVEEMERAFLGSVFMPHGLGHLMGKNVHDVGGYPCGVERPKEPGVCYLRTARSLEAGMVITVEPGVYFNDPTLDKALRNPDQARFINLDVLARFRGFGGVRLEDDVLVTETGADNLTILPMTAEEIERVIAQAQQRPAAAAAPAK